MGNAILEGITVLDLANENGVFCTRMLAMLGAEVIKVEPLEGVSFRHNGPFFKNQKDPEKSLFHLFYDEGKKSITLNLNDPKGQEIFRELVKSADVLVETSKPGTMNKLGLDYDTLKKYAPKLVMCSITPFGQNGPYAEWNAASDIIPYAIGGPMYETGIPGREPLQVGLNFTADLIGVIAVSGIVALLYSRQIDGLGDYIDISIAEAAGTWRGECYGVVQNQHRIMGRAGSQGMFVPMNYYPCKDGYVQLLGAGKWEQCIQWMKEKGIDVGKFDDPKFGGPSYFNAELIKERDAVNALMTKLTMMYTKQDFMVEAQARNIPAGASETAFSVMESPHYKERGLFHTVHSPIIGDYRSTGSPLNFSDAVQIQGKAAPTLGEHNEEIYTRLGYSNEDLKNLATAGII